MTIKIMAATKEFALPTQTFVACKDISLDINKGDFMAFVGHTGSGKSTLLSMIGGIMRPSSGAIYYDSVKISDASEQTRTSIRRKHFSYIFQYPVIVPTLSVIDNILMPLAFKNGVNQTRIKHTKENLYLFGLDKKELLPASKLSGGEMKKVSILRALAYGGDVLIADEPTSDLDPESTRVLVDIFHKLNSKGTTIIMVTHAHSTASHAKTVYEMSHGRIIKNLK